MYDFIDLTTWKSQNYRDSKYNSGCQVQGEKERVGIEQVKHRNFQGGKTILNNTVMTPCIGQKPQNFTVQRLTFNVGKFLKLFNKSGHPRMECRMDQKN